MVQDEGCGGPLVLEAPDARRGTLPNSDATPMRLRIAWLAVPALVAASCASRPVPIAERPTWPPVGATWTLTEVTTGSFGSAKTTRTARALGPREWNGRKIVAIQ